MKKLLILLLLFFCTGCTTNSVQPEIDNNFEDSFEDLEDFEDDLCCGDENDEYNNLLLSYVFINVVDKNKILLPTSILDKEIHWYNNDKKINSIEGSNNTYKLVASIGNNTTSFTIIFENNSVKEIHQQELIFRYMFITNTKKLGTSMTPDKIVIHNTANTASAFNEVSYLNSSSNTSSTSFHYAVDDIGIYQAIPTNIYGHHAGDLQVNKKSIGIEIAKSTSTNTTVKDKAISNSQKLIRLLQMYYNISELLTHKDVTGKHCPHDIIDRYGLVRFYQELKNSYY